MKKLVLATAILCAAGAVHAAESPEWNYVGVNYQDYDFDGLSLDGFGLTGSALLGENVFITGDYSQTSGSGVDIDWLSVGVGYKHAVSSKTDLYGALSYEDLGGDASETGYGLTAGIRSMVTSAVELGAALEHVDIDGTETGASVSAKYYFSDKFSVGASLGSIGDIDTMSVGAFLHF